MMKSTLLFLFCVLFYQLMGQTPKLEAKPTVIAFPETNEGIVLEGSFKIKNTGDAPLVITDYKVACPCTKITLPTSPIMPGQTFEMKVTFDTNGKSFYQDRAILLQTNTKKKEEKLRIKAFVIPKNG